jgi:hypothetical protein
VFTSVTICVPGQSSCQTIGGVLVDTGSSGLRLLGSAVSLTLPRPSRNASRFWTVTPGDRCKRPTSS